MRQIFVLVICAVHFFFLQCQSGARKNESARLVLVDSLLLGKGETLYWYYFADELGGMSISYMSITDSLCKLSTANADISGDLIYEINRVDKDSIFITSFKGFNVLKNNSRYIYVNKGFNYGQSFSRHNLKKEILLDKLCK